MQVFFINLFYLLQKIFQVEFFELPLPRAPDLPVFQAYSRVLAVRAGVKTGRDRRRNGRVAFHYVCVKS
jgi:hypothetical protein